MRHSGCPINDLAWFLELITEVLSQVMLCPSQLQKVRFPNHKPYENVVLHVIVDMDTPGKLAGRYRCSWWCVCLFLGALQPVFLLTQHGLLALTCWSPTQKTAWHCKLRREFWHLLRARCAPPPDLGGKADGILIECLNSILMISRILSSVSLLFRIAFPVFAFGVNLKPDINSL